MLMVSIISAQEYKIILNTISKQFFTLHFKHNVPYTLHNLKRCPNPDKISLSQNTPKSTYEDVPLADQSY